MGGGGEQEEQEEQQGGAGPSVCVFALQSVVSLGSFSGPCGVKAPCGGVGVCGDDLMLVSEGCAPPPHLQTHQHTAHPGSRPLRAEEADGRC